MQIKEVLGKLQIGSSVAEFDENLERYFVETETFRALVQNRADVIAGDKGTGKTAIFRVLQKRYGQLEELNDVEIISGFNQAGNPIFQTLAKAEVLSEGDYIGLWKAYILSLVGNWLLGVYEDAFTPKMKALDELLQGLELRSADDSAATIFGKLTRVFWRLLHPKSAQAEITFLESGIPVVTPKIEFGDGPEEAKSNKRRVSYEEALRLLNDALEEAELNCWVMLDRLDEAFQGYPTTEIPALRALLRTYLDLMEFDRFRLKLFVRKDLFKKVTAPGFVNLTHINARKIEIVWDEEDLMNLLCRRIKENADVVKLLDLSNKSDKEIFERFFPPQVDVGDRKPAAWAWIMSRIRDGNGVKPPRNLIDLVSMAREAQLRKEDRSPREMTGADPLIEADSIRRALSRLSDQRVQDTLLAEAGSAAPLIERFREGKAEQNARSLAKVFGIDETAVGAFVKPLVEIGFLEELSDSYKVPSLYRDGLKITQGKAF